MTSALLSTPKTIPQSSSPGCYPIRAITATPLRTSPCRGLITGSVWVIISTGRQLHERDSRVQSLPAAAVRSTIFNLGWRRRILFVLRYQGVPVLESKFRPDGVSVFRIPFLGGALDRGSFSIESTEEFRDAVVIVQPPAVCDLEGEVTTRVPARIEDLHFAASPSCLVSVHCCWLMIDGLWVARLPIR
jgi:hypothetical protein